MEHALGSDDSVQLLILLMCGQGQVRNNSNSHQFLESHLTDCCKAVMLEGGCQAHRVGYLGSAMICKKLLPEIESK